jgi:hypothetical protein
MSFNLDDIIKEFEPKQYEHRIQTLQKIKKFDTSNIEQTVNEVAKNIFQNNCRSLVIYGEPQSGKTEMMIALTAKLLDKGKKHLLILVTDNVKLRDQNLSFFVTSGISPAPMDNYAFLRAVKETKMDIKKNPFVVFCKKNASELRRLIKDTGLQDTDDLVIIDDEADYASPNSKINKKLSGEEEDLRSVINDLISKMMNKKGVWIGVTATPGRLDLNNTFANNNKKWVYLPPHKKYFGQYHFFPPEFRKNGYKALRYKITPLPEIGDDPSFLKKAVYSFLSKVAKRNIEKIERGEEEDNYSMIVHTSTGKEGHKRDFLIVDENIFKQLKEQSKGFDKHLQNIYEYSLKKYKDQKVAQKISKYVFNNRHRYKAVVMNSDKDMRSQDFDSGTNPQSPFTFIFGGNIISRGLTFHGLLSMYFSRDSKHKLDSGTYIQRARMFGNREKLFDDFELIIPEKLYFDWWTVFKEHRESLATINGFDSPLWFSSERTKTTQESSIDKANIISESGEMYWEKFKLTTEIEKVYEKGIESNRLDCVKDLFRLLGHKSFHKAFYDEIINDPDSLKDKNIYIQNIRSPKTGWSHEEILRDRGGVIDGNASGAEYWLALYKNDQGYARLFYRSYLNRKVLSHIRD